MKVFSICGYSGSGKTTTAENLIRALTARGYRVGSVKEIHADDFALDGDPAGDTCRHRDAGAALVTARGLAETDVLFPAKLDMRKILSFYDGFDYVLCESVRDLPLPMIVTADSVEDLEKNWSDYVFCVSGRIADSLDEYRGIPAFSALSNAAVPADIARLADLVEAKVYDMLPGFDAQSCGACGGDCLEMGKKILRGQAKRSDCASGPETELTIDGRRAPLVPFVQKTLRGCLLGYLRELKGYRDGAEIILRLR